ncbi:MAG: hypothetical protein IJN63_01640 [Clostridia bacterium]|nr:hypothetical protein [Clostridia bacterium]
MIFENFREALEFHARKYPIMSPVDCIKLAYQSEFGCGHFVDAGKALERLRQEMAATAKTDTELFEHIGNGRARLMLSSRKVNEEDISLISRMFAASALEDAEIFCGGEGFEKKLDDVLILAETGTFSFSREEAERCFEAYKKQGGGAVSHSEEYRRAYCPAYRVMSPSAVRVYALAREVERIIREKGSAVICIDGMAASGKTTLARFMQNVFDCNVIHADHFFLPKERKTEKRLSEAGGNIDRERLFYVLCDAVRGEFAYRPFLCGEGCLGEELKFSKKPLLLVEGSYSAHTELSHFYDLIAYSRIEKNEQDARLKRRDPWLYGMFVNTWVPLEDAYFEKTDLAGRADIIV